MYVDEDHRWKGVARGLYESLFAVCRVQGFHSAYAGTTIPNPASVAFHEQMGFEPIGTYEKAGYTNGDWHDMRWFAKSLNEHPSDPEPPLSIAEARLHEEWNDALAAGESGTGL